MPTKLRPPAPGEVRGLAARILRDIDRRQGFSNRVLSEHLERRPTWDTRDRGLVTTLVYGVLRHRTRLDAQIDAQATRPAGLRGEVRQLLRVGAYELRALDHPPHAVLTEVGHAAARLSGGAGLRRAIHGILAAVAEHGAALDEALAAAAPLDVLERRWSIPRWLAGRWRKQLGPERALARAQALAEPPPLDIRLDLHRGQPDALRERLVADHPHARIEPVPEQPQALRIHGAGDLFHGPLHAEGLVSVQGLAAQQPARWLDPRPGERVLDACAGLGVKTLQLAELMQRRGTLVAADLDPRHRDDHHDLAVRGRLPDALGHRYVVADLSAPVDELDASPFDAVLLDVPCTGLGNLARHPEIRWLRRYEDIAARATLQRALLRQALERVRPGGRLVYAVCSPEPEEGPAVVTEVLADDPRFTVSAQRCFCPEDDHTEGFFVARLERAPRDPS
ncbi:MAG: transcription antitermination factor NusB [Myxococcota bacterium]